MLSLDFFFFFFFGFHFCIWAIAVIPTVLEYVRVGNSHCQSGFGNQDQLEADQYSRICALFYFTLSILLPFYLLSGFKGMFPFNALSQKTCFTLGASLSFCMSRGKCCDNSVTFPSPFIACDKVSVGLESSLLLAGQKDA